MKLNNAKTLAYGLAEINGIALDTSMIHTNIVYFNTDIKHTSAETLVAALNDNGVKMLASGPQQIRAVINYHIQPDDISFALSTIENVVGALA